MRSALVVAVPSAAPLVEAWLDRTAQLKPSNGVPPHVTILFPFVPAERLAATLHEELAGIVARHEPFGFTLRRTARFPTTLYLAPEPAGPFAALTAAIVRRWPEHPPYQSVHAEVIPHLSVAHGEHGLLDLAEAEVAPRLPLGARATEVSLLVEVDHVGARWESRARYPLGGSPPDA